MTESYDSKPKHRLPNFYDIEEEDRPHLEQKQIKAIQDYIICYANSLGINEDTKVKNIAALEDYIDWSSEEEVSKMEREIQTLIMKANNQMTPELKIELG